MGSSLSTVFLHANAGVPGRGFGRAYFTVAFLWDHPGCMLRSVDSAQAASMMLVQIRFRCADLISVRDVDRQQS